MTHGIPRARDGLLPPLPRKRMSKAWNAWGCTFLITLLDDGAADADAVALVDACRRHT